jgi:hypothetical protein
LTRSIPTDEFALYALNGSPAAGPFSAASYSRYKYGSVSAADGFARALGAALGERFPDVVRAPRVLMASSPYKYVPTAATTLARRLRRVLNAARAAYGLPPAPLVQVERAGVPAGDYGLLSAQDRDQLMTDNVLSFRRFRPDQVRDAHLLLVDDVRVTGAHQRCLMRASDELPVRTRTFAYIAAVPGSLESGQFDPTLEDALNHAAVGTLNDLAALVAGNDFAWNVRVCKFVLSPANRDELPGFLAEMPGWFVRDLYRNSRRDGYALLDAYAPSHAAVGAELGKRRAELDRRGK